MVVAAAFVVAREAANADASNRDRLNFDCLTKSSQAADRIM